MQLAPIFRTAIFALMLQFNPLGIITASAQKQCDDFMQFTTDYAKEFGPLFDSYTLQTNGTAKFLLNLYHETPASSLRKWILLEYQSPGYYCLKSEGIRMNILADVADNSTEKRYGMPGSGYPRCSSKDEILGGLNLRLWANRELGHSYVFFFSSPHKSDISLLIGHDGAWIIIEHEKANLSCYLGRGNTAKVVENLSLTGKWSPNQP